MVKPFHMVYEQKGSTCYNAKTTGTFIYNAKRMLINSPKIKWKYKNVNKFLIGTNKIKWFNVIAVKWLWKVIQDNGSLKIKKKNATLVPILFALINENISLKRWTKQLAPKLWRHNRNSPTIVFRYWFQFCDQSGERKIDVSYFVRADCIHKLLYS